MEHEQSLTNIQPLFNAMVINHRNVSVIGYDYDQAMATSSNSTVPPISKEQNEKKYDKC